MTYPPRHSRWTAEWERECRRRNVTRAILFLIALIFLLIVFCISSAGCAWINPDSGGLNLTATAGAEMFHAQLTAIATAQP